MSATIGLFYERVSRAIRRGIKYDDDIPGYAADAVRELEDAENWKYMWTQDSASTLPKDATTLVLTRLKSVRSMKLLADDGKRIPLRKIQYEDVTAQESGRPGAYWMQDRNTLEFDAKTDKIYKYTIGYFQYSAVPLVDTLAWLTLAEDLLVARTIRKMQPLLRDDKLTNRWGTVEGSRMPALLEAEVVSEFEGEDNVVVPFTREVEEWELEGSEFT